MVTNQAYIFLIFVLNGILIGFIFDTFRILRISFKTKDIVTYIEDILFWILTGGIIIYSIFVFNNGEIRFYTFFGIVIGVVLYMMLFSTYIIKGSVEIIKIVKIPFRYILKIFRRVFIRPISFITINIKKSFARVIRHLYSFKKCDKKIQNMKN